MQTTELVHCHAVMSVITAVLSALSSSTCNRQTGSVVSSPLSPVVLFAATTEPCSSSTAYFTVLEPPDN